MAGELYVAGFGPGSPRARTPEAVEAIMAADVVVGYKTYIELISDLLEGRRWCPPACARRSTGRGRL